MLKSYHDPTMAQGVRVQLVLPPAVAERLKAIAKAEGRTVSSLGSFLIEAALKA
jgi:predicted DNA-binding protein